MTKIEFLKMLKAGTRDFSDQDLRNMNLKGLDLRWMDFRRSNLSKTDLRFTKLQGTDFSGANLRGANLYCAGLQGANLYCADLQWSDLQMANLQGSNLAGVDLFNTNLDYTDLTDVSLQNLTLTDTSMQGVRGAVVMAPIPETGSFIAWKMVRDGGILKLRIPADAKRTGCWTSRKCRADKVVVLEGHGTSIFDTNVHYAKGKIVMVKEFNPNPKFECAPGLHFFMTRQEAGGLK